jgi:polysaccharide export outer membrane protein
VKIWRKIGAIAMIRQPVCPELMESLMNRKAYCRVVTGFVLVVASMTGHAQVAASPSADLHSQDAVEPSPSETAHAAARPRDATYVIGDEDLLVINVWKEPEVSRSIPVRSDGRISLPLIGEIQAAGRTPVQLEKDIAAKLRTYITDPDVTVIVQQINSQKFNILGRVLKPGSYPLTGSTTVLDAIAAAGGFQDFAKEKDIYILRANPAGGETRLSFNYKDVIRGKHPEENIRLESHDTVVVP